jgi:hypothetical protein
MTLCHIPAGTWRSGIGGEVAFTDAQGVKRVKLVNAESVGKLIGDFISNLIGSVGDVTLETVNSSRGTATCFAQDTTESITEATPRRRRFVGFAVKADEVLAKGGGVESQKVVVFHKTGSRPSKKG